LDLIDPTRSITLRVRVLFVYRISYQTLQSGIPTTRDSANIDLNDFQERSFARSDDEIELRNKLMTYQISNVDLSAISVSTRKRSNDIAIFSTYAESGDNDKTPASS